MLMKQKLFISKKSKAKPTKCTFNIGNGKIKIVPSYKYLGILFDQHLSFKECAQSSSDSAGIPLSSVISKLQGQAYIVVGYHAFTKLFATSVRHISDYDSAIWSTNNKSGQKVENRAIHF